MNSFEDFLELSNEFSILNLPNCYTSTDTLQFNDFENMKTSELCNFYVVGDMDIIERGLR